MKSYIAPVFEFLQNETGLSHDPSEVIVQFDRLAALGAFDQYKLIFDPDQIHEYCKKLYVAVKKCPVGRSIWLPGCGVVSEYTCKKAPDFEGLKAYVKDGSMSKGMLNTIIMNSIKSIDAAAFYMPTLYTAKDAPYRMSKESNLSSAPAFIRVFMRDHQSEREWCNNSLGLMNNSIAELMTDSTFDGGVFTPDSIQNVMYYLTYTKLGDPWVTRDLIRGNMEDERVEAQKAVANGKIKCIEDYVIWKPDALDYPIHQTLNKNKPMAFLIVKETKNGNMTFTDY